MDAISMLTWSIWIKTEKERDLRFFFRCLKCRQFAQTQRANWRPNRMASPLAKATCGNLKQNEVKSDDFESKMERMHRIGSIYSTNSTVTGNILLLFLFVLFWNIFNIYHFETHFRHLSNLVILKLEADLHGTHVCLFRDEYLAFACITWYYMHLLVHCQENDKKCVCVHLCVLLLSSNKDQQSGKLMQAVRIQPGDLI
jgi:hypothetical protein